MRIYSEVFMYSLLKKIKFNKMVIQIPNLSNKGLICQPLELTFQTDAGFSVYALKVMTGSISFSRFATFRADLTSLDFFTVTSLLHLSQCYQITLHLSKFTNKIRSEMPVRNSPMTNKQRFTGHLTVAAKKIELQFIACTCFTFYAFAIFIYNSSRKHSIGISILTKFCV